MSSTGPGCEMADTPVRCKRKVPSDKLMCGPHWWMVPKGNQKRVYATLNHFGVLSDEYRKAVSDAVDAVLQKAGK